MSQPKPHLLVGKIGPWGDPRLDIECPYEFGESRPCVLGMPLPEGERCLWYEFESGKHHESCPASKDADAECADPNGDAGAEFCWPEEPEECDGFYAEDGHLHPVPGCYAEVLIGELGWQEAITFGEHEGMKDRPRSELRSTAAKRLPDRPLTLPMEVHLDFMDDVVHVAPWPEAQAMLEERRQRSLQALEDAGPILHERAVTSLMERGVSRERAEEMLAEMDKAGEELRKATS